MLNSLKYASCKNGRELDLPNRGTKMSEGTRDSYQLSTSGLDNLSMYMEKDRGSRNGLLQKHTEKYSLADQFTVYL